MAAINTSLAAELGVAEWQVKAAVDLLDGGATVPFIARYRKEVTGTLDDAQLRTLEERLAYLRDLEARRAAVLEAIEAQGKLEAGLKARILAADTKARLEDLYLPFKLKRRTKAQIAREAGLAPLAEALLARPDQSPEAAARAYVDAGKGVADVEAALEGARAILIERFGEDPELVGSLRETGWQRGRMVATVKPGKAASGEKFSDYFDFSEALAKLPSHRILALFRGEKEEVLDLAIADAVGEEPAKGQPGSQELRIAKTFGIRDQGRPGDAFLMETVRRTWRTRLKPATDTDLRARLWAVAEAGAVTVFAGNLRDLLLAAPAGARPTLGLDPGFRTGVKVAVVDATGKVVATDTIYPHEPRRDWNGALIALAKLCRTHKVELVAIGNGTASRETDKLAAELIAKQPELKLTKVMVSEAGASVYSASAYASAELPELDVSIRGAVSIARRLQDPLAELVKIEPKAIGVGQYQHDLAEGKLARSLDAVVEDCVNGVGVDVNTASAPLLARVSGLTARVASNIIGHRDAHGPFRSRAGLKKVAGLGPKAYELAAGFLRIRGGTDPLDASGVHPEAYPVVRRILTATGQPIQALIGNTGALRSLDPKVFTDATFGLPTVTDILSELEKPGRDPRPAFRTATFQEGVEKIADLKPGMRLEGVVTNVAAFGAFVDVGVHQDGLVHISMLADRFVKDPREVVKPGDVVQVRVVEVDPNRKRIALTMRSDEAGAPRPAARREAPPAPAPAARPALRANPAPAPEAGGALAEALRRAALAKGMPKR
ncbi:RNA-binding transcriptional accessory protein [Methylobacterium sp. Leaf465]|uniref:Tex family protein n=1 Tax=unclassified Methylobacterium TaxID=2615210 RepID=UPI0006F54AA9|nr:MULTISPECIES: Tex family protein [unclassified Methylobacterium]KQP50719.1 RNA-binding transcriptional accessory protein [Methylobacterium sp. Leaf111]KQT73594.1 RNA-binding transcriptional accessory protein [Methylobacterium sp. Leaf465]